MSYPTPFGTYADQYVEAAAQCYDAILTGLGDALREAWFGLADLWTESLCRCAKVSGYHDWNCELTPIWAQTIRELDTNPWTVLSVPELELP